MSTQMHPDRLWQWLLHEDALFDSRTGVFLTLHGLLIAAVGFSFGELGARPFRIGIAVLGVLFGALWWVIAHYAAQTVRALTAHMEALDPGFSAIINGLSSRRRMRSWSQVNALVLMARVVTVAWLVCALFLWLMGPVSASPTPSS